MACILCQFDLPRDPLLLQGYIKWMTDEALSEVMAIGGVQQLTVYRNFTGATPQVTAMAFFEDVSATLQAAGSDAWKRLLTNLTRYGCDTVTLTVLVPSPLFPKPLTP